MLIINVFVSFTSPDQQYLIYSSWSDYSKLKNSMIPKYHDNKLPLMEQIIATLWKGIIEVKICCYKMMVMR